MRKEEVIKFANDNPICYMATIEDDKPHVRIMKLWFADNSGFYFEALSPKDLSRQIHKNPKVEVCFFNNPADLKKGREMRISGNIEFVHDAAMIHKARKEHQYLEDLGDQSSDPYVEVFKLAHGDAKFWYLKTNILYENVADHLVF